MFNHILLLSFLFASTFSLSQDDYDTIHDDLVSWLRTDTDGRDHLPTAVRLAFHDCVGGCDGCINQDNPANVGLSDYLTAIETKYQALDITISRADYWAIAGIAGIDGAILNANGDNCNRRNSYCIVDDIAFEFKSGRVDCSTSPDDSTSVEADFPDPHMNRTEMFEYFEDSDGFNFTADEIVALMGAHTLGTAARDQSGWLGAWVTGGTHTFDNAYYTIMRNDSGLTWTALDVSEPNEDARWQYDGRDSDGALSGFMLGTDFDMYYDIVIDSEGEPSCSNPHDCEESDTYGTASGYADDVNTWIADFRSVFTKMIEHGSDNLEALT